MKKILLSLLAVLCFSGCSTISDKTEALIGKPVPYTRVSILDGDYVSLRSYRGKTLIIAFWATWCSRSKKLMAKYSEIGRRNRDPRVEMIAVSIDDYADLETLRNMVYLQGYDGVKHAFSGNGINDEAFLAFHMIAVPTFVVVGPDGYVKDVDDDLDVVEKYVRTGR